MGDFWHWEKRRMSNKFLWLDVPSQNIYRFCKKAAMPQMALWIVRHYVIFFFIPNIVKVTCLNSGRGILFIWVLLRKKTPCSYIGFSQLVETPQIWSICPFFPNMDGVNMSPSPKTQRHYENLWFNVVMWL